MKIDELRNCDVCGGRKMLPVHYRLQITYQGVIKSEVDKTLGLAQALGGELPLATMMGPNPDVTQPLQTKDALVCMDCMTKVDGGFWGVLFLLDEEDEEGANQ